MSLPLFDGCNYTLTRESPEMELEIEEAVDGGLKVGMGDESPRGGAGRSAVSNHLRRADFRAPGHTHTPERGDERRRRRFRMTLKWC